MRKEMSTLLIGLAMASASLASPAHPSVTKTATIDGNSVQLTLKGDAFTHYWITADGLRYIETADGFIAADEDDMTQHRQTLMARKSKSQGMRRAARRVTSGEDVNLVGKKRGLVILVNFTDKKFKTTNDTARFGRILNEVGYTSLEGHNGSAHDYFLDQSNGLFDLTFDVVGPVQLSNNMAYYGANDRSGNDTNAGKMVQEAVNGVADKVNFADYDWDGDGYVDQVFVLYAGYGEADSGEANTIWPHMWDLYSQGLSPITYNGVIINTYACSSELSANGKTCGIGTFCHEFSHCLGFADLYDINSKGVFSPGAYDLMDEGSYNGNSHTPAGYSAYEKKTAGWIKYIELADKDTTITNLKPTSEGGDAFVIYNQGHPDEYYVIENRTKSGWDAYIPGRGLMVTHVDFDSEVWYYNTVNTICTDAYGKNDHSRLTHFCADNRTYSYGNDMYPYATNDSLTSTSKPAATLYNNNADGTLFMGRKLINITRNEDGTINFDYVATDNGTSGSSTGDYGFYESFDKCNGTGGNDGLWIGSGTAMATLDTDKSGWSYNSGKGANKCGKFGSSNSSAVVTTPQFYLDGEKTYTLSFKAAPWGSDGTALTVNSTGQLGETSFTMTRARFTDFSTSLTGNGSTTVTFKAAKRIFLDEVIVKENTSSGISTILSSAAASCNNDIYSLDGRNMGHDISSLPHGIYITGGKKVVK